MSGFKLSTTTGGPGPPVMQELIDRSANDAKINIRNEILQHFWTTQFIIRALDKRLVANRVHYKKMAN